LHFKVRVLQSKLWTAMLASIVWQTLAVACGKLMTFAALAIALTPVSFIEMY